VATARPGESTHPVDQALELLGLRRHIHLVVPAYTQALQIARQSDLLAVVPQSCLGHAFAPQAVAAPGLQAFALPVATAPFNVAAIWHPRLDQDPAQQWFRAQVLQLCQAAYP
jgi:DNA-binding transcriptional LysR family regulator